METLTTVLTESQIQKRVGELAAEIQEEYGESGASLVAILKGSCVFLADLIRLLPPTYTVDFMQVSSWKGAAQSGTVRIVKDLDASIEGRRVLIVEDIVDTSLTLTHLRELLATRNPADIKTVALLRKPAAVGKVPVEYLGFDIHDQFVVGYGLDYEERYRGLPYIAALNGL